MRVFDTHLHIVDPRFPLVENQGFLPEPFTVDDYRARFEAAGGAVVSGSFQAYDQGYLIDALERLGPTFVGVAQVPPGITEDEVRTLHSAGVRAFRANLHRNTAPTGLVEMARRLDALVGWHLEVYGDPRALPRGLNPERLVIDHLGLTADALPALLELVACGARVKATRFGALTLDVPATLRAIVAVNPAALLFGTDLPGTRSPRPFVDADLELVAELGGERALWDNAAALYLPDGP
ncbi:amidohydrolase family protein [Solirubrobacter phytolaccae]|uniref:Amidohydrolase family protein n=1 Tax=Solirubrobacter phytolaccae TaxID=1404360 RepID=A0A9X3NK35_9ACTN|nr:amidohydrolase family protein [Solirubrobacter phytolaccae]MDA0182817.1 amidohydrolase family protein [Solirubrobacter phytolaccae]